MSIGSGEKSFENAGRLAVTVRLASVAPLLPSDDVRSPDVFRWVPKVVDVTSTVTVHVRPAPTEASASEIVVPPAGAVRLGPAPPESGPHVVPALAGVAMTTPGGSVSLNASSSAGLASAELSMVNVSVVSLPGPIVSGVNTLTNKGGAAWAAGSGASTTIVIPSTIPPISVRDLTDALPVFTASLRRSP